MKAYLKYLLFSAMTLMLCSCSEESRDEPEIADPTPAPTAEYYVKYEATVSSKSMGNNVQYTVRTDKGSQTFISGKSFSEIFGPVEKGFTANILVNAGGWYDADCTVKIYVCRGSEPFALKANASGGMMASTSYKIDY